MPVILATMTDDRHPAPMPEGLLVELATPLTPAGGLDRASLARLLGRAAPSAAGLVAGSPGVGEALELPRGVRLELFAALGEALPRELPLFFGITAATLEDTQSLALELENDLRRWPIQRPVYWVDLPLWWHSNRGLPQTYLELGQQLSRPLILMNHPHLIRGKARPWKHVNIRTAIFKKLAALPGVSALIYQGEMRRFLNYYAARAARPDFMLYEADERRFLTRPGARGLVSAGAQLFPEVWLQVVRACLFPEQLDGLGSRRRQMMAWSDILLRLQELYQLNPAPLLKLGLYHQGAIDFPAIQPSTPSCPAHLGERFLELLDEVEDTLTAG